MTTLFLIRHGENQTNIEKTFSYKIVDLPLTEKGNLQAQQTAEYFDNHTIQAIYSSPLQRAMQTAQIISNRLKVQPIIVMPEFLEFNYGSLDGKPRIKENIEQYVPVLIEWVKGNLDSRFPEGENGFEFYRRVFSGLGQIAKNHPGRNSIVISHGGPINFFVHKLCTNAPWDRLFTKEIKNGSISEVSIILENDEIKGELVSWANIDHLNGIARDFNPSEVPHQVIAASKNYP
jgi:alpha-ribazole phosphatase